MYLCTVVVLLTILTYFAALFAISRLTVGRRATNETFFRAGRRSPWPMVAFGMIGASISGVTFVSVPGMVLTTGMTYLQLSLGFILGYAAVAFVLLPLYYRLSLTSIYTYLGQRLGRRSYLSGAWFFVLSKLAGSAVKFYVVCLLLQQFVLDALGVPFVVNALSMVLLIWLYTRRGGVRTLVFTDVFQTVCLFTSLLLIIYIVVVQLGYTPSDAWHAIASDSRSRVFVFDDWLSPQNFWKQLLSGAFIVIVMTGLDQDMMQKNLTCRTLRQAQANMCSYGVCFLPANMLFLGLGILLAQLFELHGAPLPSKGDTLLPLFVEGSILGTAPSAAFTLHDVVLPLFTLGIVAASFSSADSALTSLTTSYCVDIRQQPADERLRRRAHAAMCGLFAVGLLLIRWAGSTSLIDTIYTLVGYTYGPLLGLFAFGLFTRRGVADRWVPVVCVASPLLCWGLSQLSLSLWHYRFGYELLLVNGLLTFLGLWLAASPGAHVPPSAPPAPSASCSCCQSSTYHRRATAD